MAFHLSEPADPSPADRETVLAPLRAYNIAQAGDPHIRPIAILVTAEDGTTDGGLWGRIGYDWMFIELLGLPEALRGQGLGRALMHRAEALRAMQGAPASGLIHTSFMRADFTRNWATPCSANCRITPQG